MPHSLRLLPSAVLHCWMCPPTIPTSRSYSSLLPPSCLCAPALFPSITTTHLGQTSLGQWKSTHHILCKNPLNPTQVLRKRSYQTPGHIATIGFQQKSYLVPNRFSQPEHNNNNENHFSNIWRSFWKTRRNALGMEAISLSVKKEIKLFCLF